MLTKLFDASGIKSRCTGTQLATRISPKVNHFNRAKIDFRERQRDSIIDWLCFVVNLIDKHTKELLSGSVHVYSPTRFSRRLDFNPFVSGFDGIIGVDATDDEIGMSVEILVLT